MSSRCSVALLQPEKLKGQNLQTKEKPGLICDRCADKKLQKQLDGTNVGFNENERRPRRETSQQLRLHINILQVLLKLEDCEQLNDSSYI